jgi:septum formation protein
MASVPLILASGSPRRQELLRELGVLFEVVVPPVMELDPAATNLTPAEFAVANARLKAEGGELVMPCYWILGADTVVALEGRILGKPKSLEQARDFLRALSGRTHEVITGVALLSPEGVMESFYEVSRVTFRALTEEVITRYLAEVHVLDKAGGYALQERGEWIVASVEGSRANVIGLPVEKLSGLLRAHGFI